MDFGSGTRPSAKLIAKKLAKMLITGGRLIIRERTSKENGMQGNEIRELMSSDGLRIGINADYAEVVYHQFDYDDGSETIVLRMGQVSSKVGPNISYSPVSPLVFDGFIKAKVSWIAGSYFTADDPTLDEEAYTGAMGFGFSTGLNVRYGILMVGFDYSSNNIKMNNQDDADDYLGNFFDENDSGDKTKMAYFNFTIGLNF